MPFLNDFNEPEAAVINIHIEPLGTHIPSGDHEVVEMRELALDVENFVNDLHREFDEAFATTRLPEQPDYTLVNAFLVKARRSMVQP